LIGPEKANIRIAKLLAPSKVNILADKVDNETTYLIIILGDNMV